MQTGMTTTMTSMEQMVYIDAQSKKLGISYGEWERLYGHTLPKPKPTKYREREYYTEIGDRTYKERKAIDVICQMCGATFSAKRRDAQFCEECRRKRGAAAVKAWKAEKRK